MGFFGGKTGKHWLGVIGDALQGANGQQGSYATRRARMQEMEADRSKPYRFQNNNGDVVEVDPATGAQRVLYQDAPKPKQRKTVVVDGVVFDEETGQPLFESPYNRIIAGPDGSFKEQVRYGIGRGGVVPSVQGAPTAPLTPGAPGGGGFTLPPGWTIDESGATGGAGSNGPRNFRRSFGFFGR